jgi:hypothetical protein
MGRIEKSMQFLFFREQEAAFIRWQQFFILFFED